MNQTDSLVALFFANGNKMTLGQILKSPVI